MSLLWGGLERKKPVNNLPPLAASPVMKGWKERINLVCACSDTKKIARLVGGYLKFSLWFIYFWKLFIWKVKSGQVTDLRAGGPSWPNLGRKLHLVAMCESRQLVRPRLQVYSGVQLYRAVHLLYSWTVSAPPPVRPGGSKQRPGRALAANCQSEGRRWGGEHFTNTFQIVIKWLAHSDATPALLCHKEPAKVKKCL